MLLVELTALPSPLAGSKGPTSKERGQERREWREGTGPLYFFSGDLRPCRHVCYACVTVSLLMLV